MCDNCPQPYPPPLFGSDHVEAWGWNVWLLDSLNGIPWNKSVKDDEKAASTCFISPIFLFIIISAGFDSRINDTLDPRIKNIIFKTKLNSY